MALLPVDGLTDAGACVLPAAVCAAPALPADRRPPRPRLGLDGVGPTGLAIGDLHDAKAIFSLAADTQVRHLAPVPAGESASAALRACQACPSAAGIARRRRQSGRRARLRTAADGGCRRRGRAISSSGDRFARRRRRGDHPAARQIPRPLRDLSRRHRRHAGRRHRRSTRSRAARPGAIAFRLPDRRRVRLAAVRLRRPASPCASPARAAWRRDHSLSGAGGPGPRPRQQDPHLSAAGCRPRHGRCQHGAGLQRRRARLRRSRFACCRCWAVRGCGC